MFCIRLAELNICIDNKYDYIESMCNKYLTDDSKIDFTVSATDEEIIAEDNGMGFSKEYLESLAVYRKISEKIIGYKGFLMHGVLIGVADIGIAFLAKSGVGKSTHARLWQELLGNGMKIINGDKPLVRIIGNKVFAYGTPWAGKEYININTRIELKYICFIQRSDKNNCYAIEKGTVFERLLPQIYRPKDSLLFLKTIEYLDFVIKNTEFFVTECNMDISAAKVAYEGIIPEESRLE